MEHCYYAVYADTVAGTVRLNQEGLYMHIHCKCIFDHPGIYKLYVSSRGINRKLGVLIPDEDHYILNSTIAAKYIDLAHVAFYIADGKNTLRQIYVPIEKDAPFAYIAQLEKAKLEQRGEQIGILLPE